LSRSSGSWWLAADFLRLTLGSACWFLGSLAVIRSATVKLTASSSPAAELTVAPLGLAGFGETKSSTTAQQRSNSRGLGGSLTTARWIWWGLGSVPWLGCYNWWWLFALPYRVGWKLVHQTGWLDFLSARS
jgi:hypothetical protein